MSRVAQQTNEAAFLHVTSRLEGFSRPPLRSERGMVEAHGGEEELRGEGGREREISAINKCERAIPVIVITKNAARANALTRRKAVGGGQRFLPTHLGVHTRDFFFFSFNLLRGPGTFRDNRQLGVR